MERPILYALAVILSPLMFAIAWCIVAAVYTSAHRRRRTQVQTPDEPESIPPGLT